MMFTNPDNVVQSIAHMGLLFANHDRGLEVNVDNDEKLVITRLEEQMLHVTEEYVCKERKSTTLMR